MSEERRDGKQPESSGEPAVQQINLNQVQFEAMIAEITRRMQNTYNRAQQANETLPGDNAGQERDAVAAGAQRARIGPIRGQRVELRGRGIYGEHYREESADETIPLIMVQFNGQYHTLIGMIYEVLDREKRRTVGTALKQLEQRGFNQLSLTGAMETIHLIQICMENKENMSGSFWIGLYLDLGEIGLFRSKKRVAARILIHLLSSWPNRTLGSLIWCAISRSEALEYQETSHLSCVPHQSTNLDTDRVFDSLFARIISHPIALRKRPYPSPFIHPRPLQVIQGETAIPGLHQVPAYWFELPLKPAERRSVVPVLSLKQEEEKLQASILASPIKQIEESHKTEPEPTTLCLKLEEEAEVAEAECGHVPDQIKQEEKVPGGSSKALELVLPTVEQGDNFKSLACELLIRPLVCLQLSLVEHLRVVKGLQQVVFEPGGSLCVNKLRRDKQQLVVVKEKPELEDEYGDQTTRPPDQKDVKLRVHGLMFMTRTWIGSSWREAFNCKLNKVEKSSALEATCSEESSKMLLRHEEGLQSFVFHPGETREVLDREKRRTVGTALKQLEQRGFNQLSLTGAMETIHLIQICMENKENMSGSFWIGLYLDLGEIGLFRSKKRVAARILIHLLSSWPNRTLGSLIWCAISRSEALEYQETSHLSCVPHQSTNLDTDRVFDSLFARIISVIHPRH
ncbi:hypothetical protein IGI04_042599 [Brassica rapa subsp. trilocularis]|uniref:Uncharacterized protein n=1 Tax=Brassica rapa subsp. trilocularis TaxID=1813537 RepID=A0ABQ7KKH6_BRACM|nr:hypothetical protein IGI04_042599 [Brassica rapa subsp. trilocularis]